MQTRTHYCSSGGCPYCGHKKYLGGTHGGCPYCGKQITGGGNKSDLIFNSSSVPSVPSNSELGGKLIKMMGGKTDNRRLKSKNPGKRGGVTEIQSILFKRSKGWTPEKAEEWLQKHNKIIGKVDVTQNYLRYRQKPPSKKIYQTFRTSSLDKTKGISVVYGIKK